MSVAATNPTLATTADELRAFFMTARPVAAGGVRCTAPAGSRWTGLTSENHPGVPRGLVDVRDAAPAVFVLPAPPWSEPELRVLVRPEVAERLSEAAAMLPADLRLGFWEGLRPVYVQQALWSTGLAFLQELHPELPVLELELALEQFVARPVSGIPPHSTGSAVDVAPVNAFGQALSPGDAWGRLANETLARALAGTGLANYQPEWWHWSYGDEEWARAYDRVPMNFAASPEFDGPGGGI